MPELPESPPEKTSDPKPTSTGMPWQFWLLVAFFSAWIVVAQIERNSDSSQRHRDAAWRNAEIELAKDVCDASQWFQHPRECEKMAKEEEPIMREKLRPSQR